MQSSDNFFLIFLMYTSITLSFGDSSIFQILSKICALVKTFPLYFNISEVQTNLQTNFDGFVPESLVNKISKIDGIKNYDGVIQGAGLDFKEITNIEPVKNVIQYSDDNKYKNLFDVEVHTSTEFDNKFVSKSFKLIEGRHIVATDKNKVLIHYTNAIFNTSDNVENVLSKVNIS